MSQTQEPSMRDAFMRKFMEERAAVRRLQNSGECDGSERPSCYARCSHSAYCSEWRHQIRMPY